VAQNKPGYCWKNVPNVSKGQGKYSAATYIRCREMFNKHVYSPNKAERQTETDYVQRSHTYIDEFILNLLLRLSGGKTIFKIDQHFVKLWGQDSMFRFLR